MFFDGWADLRRLIIIAPLAYIVLVFILRVTGQRTLAKMNSFDLVVTISLGSTLASVLTSNDVSLAEGSLALGLLIGLQYLVTASTVRWHRFNRFVKNQPTLLVHRGRMMHSAMLKHRVNEDEVYAAIRTAGLGDLTAAHAVVLETDGSFAVLSSDAASSSGSGIWPDPRATDKGTSRFTSEPGIDSSASSAPSSRH